MPLVVDLLTIVSCRDTIFFLNHWLIGGYSGGVVVQQPLVSPVRSYVAWRADEDQSVQLYTSVLGKSFLTPARPRRYEKFRSRCFVA